MSTFLNCKDNNHKFKYNEEFDARFCPTCDVWIEAACQDPTCEFCSGRPEKPSQTKQGIESPVTS